MNRAAMKLAARLLCGTGMMLVAGLVQAQIFVCRDAAGRTYTGDRPQAECASQPMRELRGDGMLRRDHPAPLTVQQKQQRLLEEERRRADEAAAAALRQSDRRLLLAYPTESHLEAARTRAVALLQEQISQAAAAIAAAQQRLQRAQAEPGPQRSKDISPALRDRIDIAQHTINNGQQGIRQIEAEIVQLNLRFDAEMKRYRAIVAPGASAR
ncbi:MAG: hypothetical protein ABIO19_14360 [Burkholderiaceae bacterium]